MPKYIYDEDREETIRPHKINKEKAKIKKSDHKHEYDTRIADSLYSLNYYLIIKTCKICGREGDRKLVKKDE
jgi:hypothetical protein